MSDRGVPLEVEWPALFRLARRHVERAAARTPPRDRMLRVGGVPIRFRFIGAELEHRFAPALAALEPASEKAEITLWALDGHAAQLPEPPGWPLPIREQGPGRRYWAGGRMQAYFEAVGHSWHLYDEAAGEAFFWARAAHRLPVWDEGEPFRTLFAWILDDTRFIPIHAGAVGDARGALLLLGPGGSGKSSTVLSCLRGQLTVLGDDFVLVDCESRNVHALYGSAKLSAEGLARFPELGAAALNQDRAPEEKAVFALNSEGMTALPIAAIVLPRIGNAPASRIELGRPADALRAVAPSTLLLLPGAGAGALAKLGKIIHAAPVFHLHLGHDRRGVVQALETLLDRADIRHRGGTPLRSA